ncbi:adenosylhomocysteinase [Candidatus Geothermarchaeota archaeon ex4572_27]|nr:MAG: adenosylhomocysteinase [Candidatus Geothermarchaeota archaeon ex4572_27]
MVSIIKRPELAERGREMFEWALQHMPALVKIVEDYEAEQPLKGVRVGACLHITKETSVLMWALMRLGAKVALCASNPLTTQDEIAAYLAKEGVEVFGWRGESTDDYWAMINYVIETKPQIVIDDGGDLHVTIHERRQDALHNIVGGTEETTTGVIRLRAMERAGRLRYPVIAVNDTPTKRIFDNTFGTGQSTVDGILRATSLLVAGKTVVVCGFGYVGRGVARRFRGMGANVIVTEVDPVKALEAHLEGFRVMPLMKAAPLGDIFVTCTGMKDVIRKEHMERMKDGAILANAGHFNVEINIGDLESLAVERRRIRGVIDEYRLRDGRRLYLIGEGRLVNLVAAEGHPPEVMMNSFSNQLLSIIYLWENRGKLENKVYNVPDELDRRVAMYALRGWGIEIDELTEEQKKYWESWKV